MKTNTIFGVLALACFVETKSFHYDSNDINQSHLRLDRESEYSITDIIDRHRSLTELTRDDLKTFQNPKYDSSCIRKSLEPILSKCLKNNVNDIEASLRVESAAKLSICEFEAAKISYPAECYPREYYFGKGEDSIDYQECILALEKSPQWWTTYSGNYRAIGEICLQESLPYEKDEILGLFLNITEIYDQILQDLNENVEMSSHFKEHSLKSFENLQKFMDQVLLKLEKDTNESQLQFEDKLKQMNDILEKSSLLTNMFSNDTTGMTDLVTSQINDLSSKWDGFFKQYNSEDFLDELMSIKGLVVQELEAKDSHMSNLMDKYINRLESLNENSQESVDVSEKISEILSKSLKDTKQLNDVISHTENSVMVSSESAYKLLSAFKELDQMDIGDILNVSEQELLKVFERITDELDRKMGDVQLKARVLDDELDVLSDKIEIATGSLIKINDILTNNIVMKMFIFLASCSRPLSNKQLHMLLGVSAYYYILSYKLKIVRKQIGVLIVLVCSILFGVLVGNSVVKGIERLNETEIAPNSVF